jgi:phospholipid/cholesterol/gamma-HCH transport system permease protein
MKTSYLYIKQNTSGTVVVCQGDWDVMHISYIEKEFKRIKSLKAKDIVFDVSAISDFDSAGVLLFIEYFKHFSSKSHTKVRGYSQKQKEMYELLIKNEFVDIKTPKDNLLTDIGKYTVELIADIVAFITFLGELSITIWHTITHPKSFRIKEVVYHIRHSGFDALVIIAMTSFLVGMVIAYQGAVELAKFGADIYIVDTVGISIVRELGPMITAIVIAGRSGSAYTAEIGAMKITEEISAMRTMGFDPYAFLVLPRVIALMISLPLLIFFADIIGIWGGMVASSMQLALSSTQFIERLYEVLEVKHYILGMLKGPVFAFLIASIGCFRGLRVSDNTESIGLHTTASVVNSIFLVIAFDALFSVIYTELGL